MAVENPYSAPQTAAGAAPHPTGPLTPEQQRLAQVGEVVVAWERLRIRYNVILATTALVAVVLVRPQLLIDLASLEAMGIAAIGANACFLAGPMLEAYLTWWFGPAKWLRKPIFITGTTGAVLLTLAVVLALGFDAFEATGD